mmetsp:Transcript_31978/g.58474  ORF Transcript_31978/g.58474 Transcript_31978/m.58474 type:complete len:81 (+) Transcript_31978:1385-1627(+)
MEVVAVSERVGSRVGRPEGVKVGLGVGRNEGSALGFGVGNGLGAIVGLGVTCTANSGSVTFAPKANVVRWLHSQVTELSV